MQSFEQRVRFVPELVQKNILDSKAHFTIIIFDNDERRVLVAIIDVGAHDDRPIPMATTEMETSHFNLNVAKIRGCLITQRENKRNPYGFRSGRLEPKVPHQLRSFRPKRNT